MATLSRGSLATSSLGGVAVPPDIGISTPIFEAGQAAGVDLATLTVNQSGTWTFSIDPAFDLGDMVTLGGTDNAKVRSTATVLEEKLGTIRITASGPGGVTATKDFSILVTAPQYVPEAVLSGVASEFVSPSRVVRGYNGNLMKLARQRDATNITQAAAAQVTSPAHGLANADQVFFYAVAGMTNINGLTGTVTVIDADNFTVNINSSAFAAFTGGTCSFECVARDHIDYPAKAGSDWVDWDLVYAQLGTLHPSVVTWYGQKNGRHLTTATNTGITAAQAAAQRPRVNMERRQGQICHVAFNQFAGDSRYPSSQVMQIPAAIAVQRQNHSVWMVADTPSNACTSATYYSLGAYNGTRQIERHAAGSYATNPGLVLNGGATRNTGLKMRGQYQSIIITHAYGASGVINNASNYDRVNIDGAPGYAPAAGAIATDAALVGGELGADNQTSRGYGQFGCTVWSAWSTPLNSGLDERLLHSFAGGRFGTREFENGTHHILPYGSSTMDGYRSDINGLMSQLLRLLLAAGMPCIVTGYGRSGVSISQADTDAATVAGFKDPNCTHHTVLIHGGVNDLVSNYTEAQLDTPAERAAAAATIYDSICSVAAKFRANLTVTGNRWRVVVMTQHMRDMGQIGGSTANLVSYRYDVLDRLRTLILANSGGASGANGRWDAAIDSNSDPVIATYPNPTPAVRSADDIHLNEGNGLPRLAALGLTPMLTALAA